MVLKLSFGLCWPSWGRACSSCGRRAARPSPLAGGRSAPSPAPARCRAAPRPAPHCACPRASPTATAPWGTTTCSRRHPRPAAPPPPPPLRPSRGTSPTGWAGAAACVAGDGPATATATGDPPSDTSSTVIPTLPVLAHPRCASVWTFYFEF